MAKKRPTKRPSGNKYPLLGIRPETALRAALERLAEAEDRNLSPMCVILLREALKARGLWPPQPTT